MRFPFIVPYASFMDYTPTLPTLYWDVDSHEERIKRICIELKKVITYTDTIVEGDNEVRATVNELLDEFEQFKESGFNDYYLEQIAAWIDANMDAILAKYMQVGVYFGLTADGYFCAWIPESWSEITFDTVIDYSDPLYGRLVLLFDAEGNFDYQYGSAQTELPDYEALSFKPSINGVTLIGNRSLATLGINPITSADIDELVGE